MEFSGMGTFPSYPARGTPETSDVLLVAPAGSSEVLQTTAGDLLALGGAGGGSAGPVIGYQGLTRPDMSTFTVLEENGGSNIGTLAQYAGGPITLSQVVSGGGTSLSTFLQAAPTDSTWTITTLLEIDPFLVNGQVGFWSIVYKGPSYHCAVGITLDSDHTYASKRNYDTLTDFTSTSQTKITNSAVWLRMINNGSQLLFQCSSNKIDWVQFGSGEPG
jgi:hypothetical protein